MSTPTFSFGGAGTTNMFGATQPQPQASASAPSTFTFNTQGTAAQPAPTFSFSAPAAGGLSFGTQAPAAAKPATTALPTTTAAALPTPPTTTTFSFGGGGTVPGISSFAPAQAPAPAPAQAPAPAPTPVPAQTGFSGFTIPTAATTTAAATGGPIGFSLSAPAPAQVPPTTPKGADNQGGFSFTQPAQAPPSTPKGADNQGEKPAVNLFGAGFTAQAPAQAPAPAQAQNPKPADNQGEKPAVNQLLTNQNYPFQNDTVETIIKKWKEELAGDIQRFKIQANRVSVWENQLHENFKNAQQLRQNIEKVDLYFEEIEKGCTEVETWQDELDNELEQIERNLNAHINQSDEEPNEDDIEREDILHEGENLDKYLQDMEAKLDKIMRDFNIARSEVGEDSSNNPIANIMQILNSHHNNLAWLDSKTKLLYAEINSLRD